MYIYSISYTYDMIFTYRFSYVNWWPGNVSRFGHSSAVRCVSGPDAAILQPRGFTVLAKWPERTRQVFDFLILVSFLVSDFPKGTSEISIASIDKPEKGTGGPYSLH